MSKFTIELGRPRTESVLLHQSTDCHANGIRKCYQRSDDSGTPQSTDLWKRSFEGLRTRLSRLQKVKRTELITATRDRTKAVAQFDLEEIMLGLFAAIDDRVSKLRSAHPDDPREPRPASLAESTALASSRNHSRRPGIRPQYNRLDGLPRPPEGSEGSLYF